MYTLYLAVMFLCLSANTFSVFDVTTYVSLKWNNVFYLSVFLSLSLFFFLLFILFYFSFFLSGNSVNIQKLVWSVVDLTVAIHPIGYKTSDHHSCCGSKVLKQTPKLNKNPSFCSGLWYIGIQSMTLWKLICLIQLLAWRSKILHLSLSTGCFVTHQLFCIGLNQVMLTKKPGAIIRMAL